MSTSDATAADAGKSTDNRGKKWLQLLFASAAIVLSTFVLALCSVFAKLLTALSPWEVTVIRNASQIPPALLVYYVFHFTQHYNRQHPFSPEILRRSGWKLLARGALGAMASIGYLMALQNLPLGDASAIIYANPILVALWAHCLLTGERLSAAVIIGILLTVVGVVLMAQPEVIFGNRVALLPTTTTNFTLSVVAAIATATFISFNSILSRLLRNEKATLVLLYYAVIGVAICGCITTATDTWKPITTQYVWLLILGFCVFGFVGQYLLMISYQLGNANAVSLVTTLEIVWSYILQIVVFDETPSWLSLLGAFFILISVTIIAMEKLLSPTSNINQQQAPTSTRRVGGVIDGGFQEITWNEQAPLLNTSTTMLGKKCSVKQTTNLYNL